MVSNIFEGSSPESSSPPLQPRATSGLRSDIMVTNQVDLWSMLFSHNLGALCALALCRFNAYKTKVRLNSRNIT